MKGSKSITKYDDSSRAKDWEELEFTYLRVERAVLTIQQNFRERKALREKQQTNTPVSEKEGDYNDGKDKNKEARGLDDGFWSRCATAIFIFLSGSFMTVLGIISECLSKIARDKNSDFVDVTQANIGSGPTP